MNWKFAIRIFTLLPIICQLSIDDCRAAGPISPPEPMREMRGAWIATVANIDWPTKPGLSVPEQQKELITLLDQAKQLNLNAVFFQVRPVADAFYASPLEPWSEYLTGMQGKMPSPFYDPLAFAVAEAHQRGLEIHAWFNPFRAGHPESKSPAAQNHATRTRPQLIRHYGAQTWFDPGEPESQTRALNAVLDVVKRYDVDGVVFDDYFYPYPEKNSKGEQMTFPDDSSWQKYGTKSGLSRNDWRRDNVNRFVQKVLQSVHAAKPWVRFGISPFGIWRPGVPAGINVKALDAYDKLYADARLWLNSGWVDYLAPQLYWPIDQSDLSFTTLLKWWRQQNTHNRHVWPGLYDAKLSAEEIARQIDVRRTQDGKGGEIHYHLRNLIESPSLKKNVVVRYSQSALVPASTWLDSTPPEKPKLDQKAAKNSLTLNWQNGGTEKAQFWVLQTLNKSSWKTEILPTNQTVRNFEAPLPQAVSIRAVDRVGNLSAPAIWTDKK